MQLKNKNQYVQQKDATKVEKDTRQKMHTSAKQDAMRKTTTKNNVHMKERVYIP